MGIPLNRVNWGNYDLVVIDESHNFRNDDAFKDRETRYQWLMNRIPLELDRAAIVRDRCHGQSLGQLARNYSVSRTTIHRVLQEHAATQEHVA